MSARAEAPPMRHGMAVVAFVIITALMLTLFAWINRSIFDRPAPPRPSPAVALWDASKLEAMEGRVLAETHRQVLANATISPGASATDRTFAIARERHR
ncbi:MAG: hypothetical protein L0206_04545 [Actinobacteria bacterium]|nr:hypothetical protein [Actinomycetota bacterium]